MRGGEKVGNRCAVRYGEGGSAVQAEFRKKDVQIIHNLPATGPAGEPLTLRTLGNDTTLPGGSALGVPLDGLKGLRASTPVTSRARCELGSHSRIGIRHGRGPSYPLLADRGGWGAAHRTSVASSSEVKRRNWRGKNTISAERR